MFFRLLRRILFALNCISDPNDKLNDESGSYRLKRPAFANASPHLSRHKKKSCFRRRRAAVDSNEVLDVYSRAQDEFQLEIERLRKEVPRKSMELIMLEAEINLAFSVFKRVNHVASFTSLYGRKTYEFRGLTSKQAEIIADWLVREQLLASQRIQIITGDGWQTPHGYCFLKELTQKYFNEILEVNCQVDSDNKGVLVIAHSTNI
jgi:hypothetical protein